MGGAAGKVRFFLPLQGGPRAYSSKTKVKPLDQRATGRGQSRKPTPVFPAHFGSPPQIRVTTASHPRGSTRNPNDDPPDATWSQASNSGSSRICAADLLAPVWSFLSSWRP